MCTQVKSSDKIIFQNDNEDKLQKGLKTTDISIDINILLPIPMKLRRQTHSNCENCGIVRESYAIGYKCYSCNHIQRSYF